MSPTTWNKQFIIGIVLLASLAVCACDKSPAISALPQGAVILAFGDSLTFGTGAPTGRSYPDILSGLLNRPVINAGVPGEISAAGMARLPRLLAKHQPALVILCHGGNDFLRRTDPAFVEKNLRAMIEMTRATGAEVLLIGVPALGLTVSTHPLYSRLAENLRTPLNDEIVEKLLRDRSLKSDAIHPNEQGYRLMAEAISRQIPVLPVTP